MDIVFGYIGVCVEDYTKESLCDLLAERKLYDLMYEHSLIESKPFSKNTFLQSVATGPYVAGSTIGIHDGFIQFVTDMENFLLILSVGILDPDAANSLVEELYTQGLIKPRNEPWDVLTLVM